MKKIFTLCAAILAVSSVATAQEKYVAISRDAETGVMTISDEFKAVLPQNEDGTYGSVATNKDSRGSVVVIKTANVTLECVGGSTPADVPDDPTDADGDGVADDMTSTHVDINADGTVNSWKPIEWKQKNQGDINWAWIEGTGNPAAEIKADPIMTDGIPQTYWVDGVEHTKYTPVYTYYEPDGSLGVPEVGLHFKFTAAVAGTIKLGVWVNKGSRKTYVVDGTTALPIQYSFEGYVNGQNTKVWDEAKGDSVSVKKWLSAAEVDSIHMTNKSNIDSIRNDAGVATGEVVDINPYIIGYGNQPSWGEIVFEVEAGKTYYAFCESTQLGFSYFEFTAKEGSAIEEVKANVAEKNVVMFNILGQPVSADYKGIVIKNGRKMILK